MFPVSLEEKDFAEVKDKTITLKTYGLPYIFWGYAAAILIIIAFMFLAIKAPVLKLINLGDDTDALLGYTLLSFIGFLPVLLFSFFFYEKRILKREKTLIMEYRLWGMKFFSETFIPDETKPYSIEPFLSSPNVARMNGGEEMKGFQNKGYFILWLNTQDGKRISLDRHSRKADLIKLEELLRLRIDS